MHALAGRAAGRPAAASSSPSYSPGGRWWRGRWAVGASATRHPRRWPLAPGEEDGAAHLAGSTLAAGGCRSFPFAFNAAGTRWFPRLWIAFLLFPVAGLPRPGLGQIVGRTRGVAWHLISVFFSCEKFISLWKSRWIEPKIKIHTIGNATRNTHAVD
jgi:hypothetical protein